MKSIIRLASTLPHVAEGMCNVVKIAGEEKLFKVLDHSKPILSSDNTPYWEYECILEPMSDRYPVPSGIVNCFLYDHVKIIEQHFTTIMIRKPEKINSNSIVMKPFNMGGDHDKLYRVGEIKSFLEFGDYTIYNCILKPIGDNKSRDTPPGLYYIVGEFHDD